MGALQYNLNKMRHPDESKRAILLDSNFALMDMRLIRQEVEVVRGLRPSLNRYVYHASLNFADSDKLDNEKMLAIALEFLELNGFDNNQYLIFRHYDAEHAHVHLLANRIKFDGGVVSDSNNYKKAEAILRELEIKYALQKIAASRLIPEGIKPFTERQVKAGYLNAAKISNMPPRKAPTKTELEMLDRRGIISDKIMLQEKVSQILRSRYNTLQEFISACEGQGIGLLFNQQSTGRISGITYFHNGIKIRGQALGNRFKWSEILKNINYEQSRGSAAVSAANVRTKQQYDEGVGTGKSRTAQVGNNTDRKFIVTGNIETWQIGRNETAAITDRAIDESGSNRNGIEEKQSQSPDADLLHSADSDPEFDRLDTSVNIDISDDVDDEAIYGKDRHRERNVRMNRR
ncbi:hypothetical protein GCM10023313_08010 [Mucilaginibacter defluvii]|uniref:MobA/VirD2-like nuclease domain-containing protein n=2 Tax=Mucilaginibacter defluvii TaxID=1196019 RepID=A0ABP9FQ19_9SPHI